MNALLMVQSFDLVEQFTAFLSFAKDAFASFTVADAVDILLLTALFYLVFRFVIYKKAGALIFGILVCFVVLILATLFDLSGTKFVLSGAFQIGIIAIVIIFQPEIRELLEKLGSGSLKSIKGLGDSTSSNKMQYKAIDSVCKAVNILSMQKTGALIVISKNMNLDEIIHTGTEINADISDTLIRNLFYDKSPLHDGAVIIDNGRIAAAACILPLTRKLAVDQELGTRHRAAIGLSEICDAVIIVVSEETGIVSVAKEAEFIRNYTSETLRQLLIGELIRGESN